MAQLPEIKPGKRATICGRTGSGKSTLAAWFLNNSPQHWVILNPKHTAMYRALPDSVVYKKFDAKGIFADCRKRKFTILNLSNFEADWEYMDNVVNWLHNSVRNIGLCCDELYTLHNSSGKAGPGLVGWLTRGREYKQSFLGLTQRPVWISRFCFSEADYIIEMALTAKEDRQVVYGYTGNEHFLSRVTDYRWLCYTVQPDTTVLYGPVPSTLNEASNG